ncbi:MAG: discoidin domain-containing protein [Clostridia bacterium]|nr:discoidin domain-containing protein [Clostridia bacterium]MBR5976964.1 discoidin domain-containing protein [Clostridia bacterium]
MKKIIGLLLAVALIFTLVSVLPAAAFVNVLNMDYINVLNAEGVAVGQVVGGSAVWDFTNTYDAGYIGDLKPIVNAGGVYLDIMGWYMPEKEMADIGLSFDGGEPTYGYALYDQNLIDVLVANGYGDTASLALRISAMLPIQEGTHEIAFVVKFADGTTRTIYKFRYRNLYDTVYENVALNKPVYSEIYAPPSEFCAISDNDFWKSEFINDGQAPVFEGAVVPLGWYVYTNGPDVDARAYIDLQGVYDVKEVKMTSMGFNVYSYPNTYKVLASMDGVNWTEIGGESGAGVITAWGKSRRFDTDIQARYICFNITKINLNVDDGVYYAGVGELEVFGSKVSDASGSAPYFTRVLSNYSDGVIQDPAYAAWTGFTTGDLDFEMTFKSDVPFFAIGFPAFWSQAGCPLRLDFDNGSTVYSMECVSSGDGAKVIPLGQTIPAGKYTLTMTILSDAQFSDDEKIAMGLEPSAVAYRNYLVIGSASGSPLDTEYCLYERGANLAVDLYTKEQTGVGFVKLEHDLVKFASASVSITDGISLNFKVPEALLDAGAENISVKFTLNGVDTVVTDYRVDNGKLVFTFKNISPDKMGDTIFATLSADIDGETYTSSKLSYSVLKYCQNMLRNYPGYVNKELRTLLVDLLNYGAASQAYTGHNAANPVNGSLDLYSAAYGTPIDPELSDILDAEYAVVDDAAAAWKGVALALGDTVAVRFKLEAADIEGLKVKITTDEGNWTIDSSKFTAADAADTYYATFNGLNAAQMSLPIFATVYDADGNAVSNTLRYSIESYAASMQNGSDAALAKLTMAMIKYGNSAKTYRDGLKTPKDYILANDIQGTWVREVEAALFKDLAASKLEGNDYAGVVDYLELDGVMLPVALDFNSDGTFAARLATDEAKTTVDNIVKAALRAYLMDTNPILVMGLETIMDALVRDMYMGNLVEGVYTVVDDVVYISSTTDGLVAPENASEAVIHGDVMVITKLSAIAADAETILGGLPALIFRDTGN